MGVDIHVPAWAAYRRAAWADLAERLRKRVRSKPPGPALGFFMAHWRRVVSFN
jgi:hypothetical protein